MMEENANMENALKKALEKRVNGGLPSNFSFQIMEKVQVEARKKRKKQKIILWASLITTVACMVGVLIYILVVYLDLNMFNYKVNWAIEKPNQSLMNFYWYIGGVAMLLLGLDYIFSERRRKSISE